MLFLDKAGLKRQLYVIVVGIWSLIIILKNLILIIGIANDKSGQLSLPER